MFGRITCLALLAAATLAVPLHVRAGQKQQSSSATPESLARVVGYAIQEMYVDERAAPRFAAEVKAVLRTNRYEGLSPEDLAALLTEDLQRITNDKHMAVEYDPLKQGEAITTPAAIDKEIREFRMILERGETSPADDRLAVWRFLNHGVVKSERLAGNIGLIAFNLFVPLSESRGAVTGALAAIGATDAVIIDLRDHMGGSQNTVDSILSHFFPPDRKLLITLYERPTAFVDEHHTVPVQSPLRDHPLYVLVNARTGSAGESAAYILQQFGRATVIGERTAGAGNTAYSLNLGRGFRMTISTGTAIHPRSRKGWEKEGVVPDIEVAIARAVDVAHLEAARTLLPRFTDELHTENLKIVIRHVRKKLDASQEPE